MYGGSKHSPGNQWGRVNSIKKHICLVEWGWGKGWEKGVNARITYPSLFDVVISWVWIKCSKLRPAGAEVIFRVIEETTDICSSLKYMVVFN